MAGFFDTFSMLFGWWYSSPINYRYYDLGNFYITRSLSSTQYITRLHTNIYHNVRTNTNTHHIHTTGQVT